jgi:nucleoside-diphosphate-sugar epimerase
MQLQLSGRHLFITGGTGFVGRSLLDYLINWKSRTDQEFLVTVLSRDPEFFLKRYPEYRGKKWLRFVSGSLKSLPPPAAYSDIIHAAADTHIQSNATEWVDQIVNGTADVLNYAVKCGATRFLHTSSGAVYGPQPEAVIKLSEDYCGAPSTNLLTSTYGQAKRVAEQLCTIFNHEYGLQTVNARCFAFSGKHLSLVGPYALGNFISDALYADAIHVKGDGAAVRSYLDADDMAEWLLFLLLYGRSGDAYNVGSDQSLTLLELANKVIEFIAPNKKIIVQNSYDVNSGRSRYVPEIQKAKSLGLVVRCNINESIVRMADNLRKASKSQIYCD